MLEKLANTLKRVSSLHKLPKKRKGKSALSGTGKRKAKAEKGGVPEPEAPKNKAGVDNKAKKEYPGGNKSDGQKTTPEKDTPKKKPDVPKKMKEYKPDCFKPGDSVKKAYKNNPKKMEKEFVRQLGDQEKGLNKLTVGEYLENREKYLATARKGTGQAQKAARKKLQKDINNSIKTSLKRKGVGPLEAKKIAQDRASSIMKSLAALHDPDMVAGGHDKNIKRVANKNVNSSIGSQWRDRVKAMDEAAKKARDAGGPSTKMNVKLERCR